jgi:uncharacterized membrane protein YdjX (TVP38/TMEM64 family)
MKRRGRLALGVAVAAVIVGSLVVSPAAALARLSWLAADPVRFGLALVAVCLVRPLFVWPTTLLAVAAGYGYGLVGAPVGLALVTASSLPTFVIARWVASPPVGAPGDGGDGDGPPGEDSASGVSRVVTVARRVRAATGDLRGTTAARLLPIPSDLVSAGAGIAGVSLPTFVLGTALGEAPWAVAGALAGSSLSSLAADGSLAAAVDWRLLVAAALVAVGLLAGPAYRSFRFRAADPGRDDADSGR